jgi:putative DeoR family transcriptional regulator (stage III sporulation protein D)
MTKNQKYIENRIIEEANYIIESGSTVRKAAVKFRVSKSTVHKDMIVRLPSISAELYKRVKEVLDINLAERHIRGGISTMRKYKN